MNVAISKLASFEVKRMIKDCSVEMTEQDEATMNYCLAMSTSLWAGLIEEQLACAWGLVPPSLMSNQAYLWLFHTPLVEQHKFILVRYSQLAMEEMLKEFPVIVGHAHVSKEKSIRWLKWLGAKFGEPQGKLLPFRIEASNAQSMVGGFHG